MQMKKGSKKVKTEDEEEYEDEYDVKQPFLASCSSSSLSSLFNSQN
jgi:hypothetical protein